MEESYKKENSSSTGVETQSTQLSPLKPKDSSSDYFSERAKKLVTAVYLVTNLIPQTDPLRISIRELSIKLLSYMGLMPDGHPVHQVSIEARNMSRKILELLEVAFFSGYVSEMNYSVLKTEFDLFAHEVAQYDGSEGALEQAALQVPMLSSMNTRVSTTSASSVASSRQASPAPSYSSSYKPKTLTKAGSYIESKPHTSKTNVEAKKTSRKESIISIIRLKGSVGIKDVSSVILDCSEKTIQRELQALVQEGTLKKSGDRRWSTYTLA